MQPASLVNNREFEKETNYKIILNSNVFAWIWIDICSQSRRTLTLSLFPYFALVLPFLETEAGQEQGQGRGALGVI